MSKTKSQIFYDLLKTNNQADWEKFKAVHDRFQKDPDANRDEFNRVGSDFLDIVRGYERRLCGGMERTTNAYYSSNVCDTYWKLVRTDFPLIDQIGLTVS
ncbi:hypothetical protein IJJ27_00430 [bacterium]|nr:hypothetical protein [bacterium]